LLWPARQVVVNDSAVVFTPRPIQKELEMCFRFFQKSYSLDTVPGTTTTTGIRYYYHGNSISGQMMFPVVFIASMRITPTITSYDYNGASGKCSIFTDNGGSSSHNYTCSNGTQNEKSFRAKPANGAKYGMYLHYKLDADI